MNHEQRINNLETKVTQLIEIIEGAGLNKKFIPLPQAAKQLGVNPWVIRERVKKDPGLTLGKHFKKNGSRYLINCQEWKKLIASDVKAMRQ